MQTNNLAARNLRATASASMRTGNRAPSHSSGSSSIDYPRAASRKYNMNEPRDRQGRILHPEPSNATKQYAPGEISRFDPRAKRQPQPQPQRKPAWDFNGAKRARDAQLGAYYEIIQTSSKTRPCAILDLRTRKRVSEHRSYEAALKKLDQLEAKR